MTLSEPQTQYLYREKFDPTPYLMELTKKKYLQVPHRIQWLNHDAPIAEYTSFTLDIDRIEFFTYNSPAGKEVRGCWVQVTATLYDADGKILKRVSEIGSETSSDFADFIEKASTKARGRALAGIGFGTQFAVADFDPGEKPSPIDGKMGMALADGPVKQPANPVSKAPATHTTPTAAAPTAAVSPATAPVAAPVAAPPVTQAAPATPETPAVTTSFDRTAALAWLQGVSAHPAVAQVLAAAVQKYKPEEGRVGKLTDAQLCEAYEASKLVAA